MVHRFVHAAALGDKPIVDAAQRGEDGAILREESTDLAARIRDGRLQATR